MSLKPIYRRYGRASLFNKISFSSNWRTWYGKSWLLLFTAAMLFPGSSVKAEIVMGIIENYSPKNRQATISLGKQDGVGKYDRGKIELSSLDSPDVKFIGANIVVVSVEENSAVVSVREAPGVQVPIQAGAGVTLDTDSGIARREEEAKIVAAQQAEEARRQQQLEEARAEKARRQRELEEARTEEARRQRELEEARTEEARRQQQQEAERIEQERIEQERAEEARSQQEPQRSPTAANSTIRPQTEPKVDLDEAKLIWGNDSANDSEVSSDDLPLDYLQAYGNAREQPTPETYYRFAEVLIDYEISDRALAWLDETQSRFPATKTTNNLYRAVALIQQGKLKEGQNILKSANLPDRQLTDELNSYLYTQKGEWERVIALSKTESAATYNNNLIALYCKEPFTFERDTDLSPVECPFGNAPPEPAEEDEDSDEDEELAKAKNEQKIAKFRKIGQQAIALYPDDPYILNTLGFIALQSEDYKLAYEHYQELAVLLDKYDSTPPRLQLLKANAINYVNNYNQNYEFLADNGANLEVLRSRQDSLSDAIIIGGVGTAINSAITNDISPVGLIGGVLATFLRLNQSKSKAEDIANERDSIADQMHVTFAKDIDLVPTSPKLEAKSLLNLTQSEPDSSSAENSSEIEPVNKPANESVNKLNSPEIKQKLREFDEFWQKN